MRHVFDIFLYYTKKSNPKIGSVVYSIPVFHQLKRIWRHRQIKYKYVTRKDMASPSLLCALFCSLYIGVCVQYITDLFIKRDASKLLNIF